MRAGGGRILTRSRCGRLSVRIVKHFSRSQIDDDRRGTDIQAALCPPPFNIKPTAAAQKSVQEQPKREKPETGLLETSFPFDYDSTPLIGAVRQDLE